MIARSYPAGRVIPFICGIRAQYVESWVTNVPAVNDLSPDLSVVIPTYNRALHLQQALASLLAQRGETQRCEILVVDNGSTDNTRQVVETFVHRFPEVRYLFESRPGVSRARNTGIAAATAPVVAFMDDDVRADPAWLSEIHWTFSANPEIDCVGGRIEGRFEEPPPAWFDSRHWGAVALQGEKGPSPYLDAQHASACLMTANFACRRAALEEVGGFSPEFFRDEDRELQLRLWASGKRGLFVPTIVVTTDVPPERLTKAYHRRYHIRVGASHARMRYLDRIDREGRLAREQIGRLMLFGTPGFIYRKLVRQMRLWIWSAVMLRWNRAFYHETRVLYLGSYIWSRCREQGGIPSRVPFELARLAVFMLLHYPRGR